MKSGGGHSYFSAEEFGINISDDIYALLNKERIDQ